MTSRISVGTLAGAIVTILLCFPAQAQQSSTDTPTMTETASDAADIDASNKAFQEQFDETEALISRMQSRLNELNTVSGRRSQELDFLNGKVSEAIEQIGGAPGSESRELISPESEPAKTARLKVDENASADQLREKLTATANLLNLERKTTDILKAERGSLAESLAESNERRGAVETELKLLRSQHSKAIAEQDARIRDLEETQGRDTQSLDFALAENDRLTKQLAELQTRMDAGNENGEVLHRYRAAFVGNLKDALGDNPFFRASGDHYMFQSDFLFSQGSDSLTEQGMQALRRLADSLRDIAGDIPSDLNWIMRIDAHTDTAPPTAAGVESNLDFSAARSVAVMRFLVRDGIGADRLAAAAFGDYQPLDSRNDEIAQRRNRRIEFRLTQR